MLEDFSVPPLMCPVTSFIFSIHPKSSLCPSSGGRGQSPGPGLSLC